MNNIESIVVELLIKNKMKLATAESCTGGLIAQKITSVAGAKDTLDKVGAVSEQTALEMCKGVKTLSNADFGISVTGIAGPGGGAPEKPVGTVWIGICGENLHKAQKFLFDGNRQQVRENTAEMALKMVEDAILNEGDNLLI